MSDIIKKILYGGPCDGEEIEIHRDNLKIKPRINVTKDGLKLAYGLARPDSKRAIFTVMTFLAQWFLAAKIRNLIPLPPVLLYQSDDSHILEIF